MYLYWYVGKGIYYFLSIWNGYLEFVYVLETDVYYFIGMDIFRAPDDGIGIGTLARVFIIFYFQGTDIYCLYICWERVFIILLVRIFSGPQMAAWRIYIFLFVLFACACA